MQILQTALKGSAATGEEKEHIMEEIGEQLRLLENQLKENDFFGGEGVGYLDIVAFSVLYFFQIRHEVMRIELISEEKFPVLWKWMGKLSEIDGIKESLPPRDKRFAYTVDASKSAVK